MRFRDLEPSLNLLERETEQRAVVLIEKPRSRGDPEHAALPLGERRRPAEEPDADAFAIRVIRQRCGIQIEIDGGISHRIYQSWDFNRSPTAAIRGRAE